MNWKEQPAEQQSEQIEAQIEAVVASIENLTLPEPVAEPEVHVETVREPVITTGKIQVEDIREVKNRGYSVNVPLPRDNNSIERIGSNKIVRNGDNNKVFFKRDWWI